MQGPWVSTPVNGHHADTKGVFTFIRPNSALGVSARIVTRTPPESRAGTYMQSVST
jgi:hypothetical protein